LLLWKIRYLTLGEAKKKKKKDRNPGEEAEGNKERVGLVMEPVALPRGQHVLWSGEGG